MCGPNTLPAALLERTFAIDVLACPECGRRLRLIATITDSRVIDKILTHLGLPSESPALWGNGQSLILRPSVNLAG